MGSITTAIFNFLLKIFARPKKDVDKPLYPPESYNPIPPPTEKKSEVEPIKEKNEIMIEDNQWKAKLPITVELINTICPKKFKPEKQNNIEGFVTVYNNYANYFGVDTIEEVSHLISQIAHEADDFNAYEEYASGKAYEGRKDLGNTIAGDGVKFKGRDPLQTTGRANYNMTGDEMAKLPFLTAQEKMLFENDNLLNKPQLLSDPIWGSLAAFIYWNKKDLNAYCLPPDQKVPVKRLNSKGWYTDIMPAIEAVTFKINGGQNGYLDREQKFYKIYAYFKK